MAISVEELRQLVEEDSAGWRKQNCVSLRDLTAAQIEMVLQVAKELKRHDLGRHPSLFWRYPRTLAMLFQKPSLRTRVSFETSMAHLQGHAVYLAPDDVGLGIREAVEDVAGTLSRWVDSIAARVYHHTTVQQLAQHATVPVINALSDLEHPVQAFADILTLQEYAPAGAPMRLAYTGDGNNVLHALLIACSRLGISLRAACPPGYEPNPAYLEDAQQYAAQTGAEILLCATPQEAVKDAHAVYTDVWTSMGQEEEKQERNRTFAPYQLNEQLMTMAAPGAFALHCMPAHRGEEITEGVMNAHKHTILEQAENRLHTQKALLMLILGL